MTVKDQPEQIPTFTSDTKLDCTKEFQSSDRPTYKSYVALSLCLVAVIRL